ncbi:hypothetical protein [Parabacteroides sp. AM08-6]|uniref:hypothetical protein n=1 Tax=Parabacteroides sp. AM08-6 TaxID=2292053 RepID=UPI000F006907|nr:hypothetical protein [Parabacteroides sp. AM08-6]RHJ80651.1 hypothetical protein DW103_12510 [Parabacteroides sp. AM08-6]
MEYKKLIHSNEYHLINTNDILKQAENIVNNLHMAAGSTTGFDIYTLLKSYFTDLEKRNEINKIIHVG